MGCCDSRGRTKWGVAILLAISAIVFTSVSAPAYFGILASKSDPESFKGCAHCIQDFGIEVLKSVNATDIADKLQKIHERNQKNHMHPHRRHHHHHRHHHEEEDDFDLDDECITSQDIDDLKPDLKGLVIPDWKEECKDVCTPVIKAVPLAATISGVLFFVGMVSAIAAIIPLCMLCCKDERTAPSQQWQAVYTAAPSAQPVGTHLAAATYAAGASSAAEASDNSKTPLLQKF